MLRPILPDEIRLKDEVKINKTSKAVSQTLELHKGSRCLAGGLLEQCSDGLFCSAPERVFNPHTIACLPEVASGPVWEVGFD